MNDTAELRNSKKRPGNNSITEFIKKNHLHVVDYNFIEEAIEKLIKN